VYRDSKNLDIMTVLKCGIMHSFFCRQNQTCISAAFIKTSVHVSMQLGITLRGKNHKWLFTLFQDPLHCY